MDFNGALSSKGLYESRHLCRKKILRQNRNDKSNDSYTEDRLGGLRGSVVSILRMDRMMKDEEQLKLAYITIAQLKDQNAKLVDAIASLEKRLAESDGRDRRVVEEFYKGIIEDMNVSQAKTNALYEEQLKAMRSTISELTSQIAVLVASGKVKSGKLYGRKSEKSSRLNKRKDDDDLDKGQDNFDGTAGLAN